MGPTSGVSLQSVGQVSTILQQATATQVGQSKGRIYVTIDAHSGAIGLTHDKNKASSMMQVASYINEVAYRSFNPNKQALGEDLQKLEKSFTDFVTAHTGKIKVNHSDQNIFSKLVDKLLNNDTKINHSQMSAINDVKTKLTTRFNHLLLVSKAEISDGQTAVKMDFNRMASLKTQKERGEKITYPKFENIANDMASATPDKVLSKEIKITSEEQQESKVDVDIEHSRLGKNEIQKYLMNM